MPLNRRLPAGASTTFQPMCGITGASNPVTAPGHWPHPVLSTPSHDQYLDVEAESIHAHAREEIMRDLGAEQLETALRVFNSGTGERLDQEVERATYDPTVELCLDADSFAPAFPRADGYVGPGMQCAFQPLDLTDRCRTVRIGEQNRTTGRIENSGADGESFSLVGRKPDEPELRKFLGEQPANRARVVAASVINQNQLEYAPTGTAIAYDISNRRLDPRCFIVCRNNDGEIGRLSHGTACECTR